MKRGFRWGFTCLMVAILAVAFMALWSASAWAQEAGPPGAPVPAAQETVTVEALDPVGTIQAAEPDYKMLYFDALKRVQELEAAFQEAIDLARGYRSDWKDERDIAEARKAQVDQTLKLADTLMGIIRDMKDTINKQHEIIMTLTQPKKIGLQLIGGAVVHPREPTNPGVLLALGWQF